jgi:surfactin synthase thioesterase subunit
MTSIISGRGTPRVGSSAKVGVRSVTGALGETWARWFLADLRRPRQEIQLLCLPHAGGGASTYRDWLATLAPDIDVVPVRLPGRESRIREPCVTDMSTLVADLTTAIRWANFGRVALFGHSLGAVIATKLCESLEDAGIGVRHLFVSGYPGPAQIPLRHTLRMAEANDDVLLESLADLDGALTERLVDAELRAIMPARERAFGCTHHRHRRHQ